MSPTERPHEEEVAAEAGPDDTGLWPAITDADLGAATSAEATAPEPAHLEACPPGPVPAEVAEAGMRLDELGPMLLAAISRMSQSLEERLGALETLFEREVRAEATRERIVDRLHSELQEYKHDLLLKVQRPIFIDLIQLHDDLGKLIEVQPTEDAGQVSAFKGTLESVRTAIEDILYRQGVEPFQTEGPVFDPRRQRAVSTIATEEPEQNKTIAARLRPGFQAGEKLIRPEIVSVFALKR